MFLQCESNVRLTNSEKMVIDYINSHLDEVVNLTVEIIADRNFVSTATATRAMRKCGIAKMSDLRQIISKRGQAVRQVLEQTYMECIETLENINIDDMSAVVQKIKTAKRIHLFADGISELVARVLEFHLIYEKYDVCVEKEEMWNNIDLYFEQGDLVIVFVLEDLSPAKKHVMKEAKDKGLQVITCCCNKDVAMDELSDITIVGSSQKLGAICDNLEQTSQLGLQIIVRMIIEYLTME